MPGQFVYVEGTRAAAQQMAQQMQGCIGELIGGMKCGETNIVDFPELAARPKFVQAARLKSLRRFIPKLEVELERDGALGVKEIAGPLPAGLADHHRQMIDGIRTLGNGLVS